MEGICIRQFNNSLNFFIFEFGILEFWNYFCAVIALLCNGSTADSGSVCLGSNPSGATIT